MKGLIEFVRAHDVADVRLLPSGQLRIGLHATLFDKRNDTRHAMTLIQWCEPTLAGVRAVLGY